MVSYINELEGKCPWNAVYSLAGQEAKLQIGNRLLRIAPASTPGVSNSVPTMVRTRMGLWILTHDKGHCDALKA